MAALKRPSVDVSTPLWSSPEDAKAAQVIRMFAGIRF
jgi:hypothetical protein